MSDVLFIVNPAGHGGAGPKAWEAFRTAWADPIDPEHVVFTQHPGHAREIADDAEGYETIAAVGGDGTVGELMSAIMDRQHPDINLAIIPAGTGNAVHISGYEEWTIGADGLIAESNGHFDEVEYERQLHTGIDES